MEHDAMLKVSGAMLRYGGSFVRALADAWRHADESNSAKIEATWPEHIAKYAKMADEMQAKESQ